MNKHALNTTLTLVLAASILAWAGNAAAGSGGPDPDGLKLASAAAAISDLDGGDPLFAKNAGRQRPIASITKLMTAMVVLDSDRPLDDWVTIVRRKKDPPNNGYSRIRIGSQLRRGDLVRIMLMSSENLAAYVLASDYPGGRDAFVAAMNDKARALGMNDSHFVGPSGLSPKNHSTAADLLKMVRAAYGYDAIREYTTTAYYRARFRKPHYTLAYGNTNPLVHSGRWKVELSKTGYLNEAGRCLIMVTRVGGRSLAVVLLDSFGTRTPLGDAGRIKRWMKTGKSGPVAGAARRYERRETEEWASASD